MAGNGKVISTVKEVWETLGGRKELRMLYSRPAQNLNTLICTVILQEGKRMHQRAFPKLGSS